eukprot:TRINITY_DN47094_c0_g1_i1.p1 TRINITY_DN47094_c0_g1~~TRINITY_DN47094_c0_g1_i1.p1  ORF type:complete len:209 (-),score=18.51 TRINITY_DN47094_c0_g1_i1:160-786(-)
MSARGYRKDEPDRRSQIRFADSSSGRGMKSMESTMSSWKSDPLARTPWPAGSPRQGPGEARAFAEKLAAKLQRASDGMSDVSCSDISRLGSLHSRGYARRGPGQSRSAANLDVARSPTSSELEAGRGVTWEAPTFRRLGYKASSTSSAASYVTCTTIRDFFQDERKVDRQRVGGVQRQRSEPNFKGRALERIDETTTRSSRPQTPKRR